MLRDQAQFFKQNATKALLHQFQDLLSVCLVHLGTLAQQTTHLCQLFVQKAPSGPEILCKSSKQL
jgi:hypothetical protein